MSGILYGIGVGPGDPELLTLKAVNCIKASDIVILPGKTKEDCHAFRIVRSVLPQVEEKELVCFPFPMTKDAQVLEEAHRHIYTAISDMLERGKTVAFLTIGDPAVYSTYSYIHTKILAAGGNAILISGVTSFCAAAAAAGIALADSDEEIHIIPGSYDIRETTRLKGTRVYMKSGKKLLELKKLLAEAPDADRLDVYTVSNCGMSDQRIAAGIDNLDENSGYLTVVLVKERK